MVTVFNFILAIGCLLEPPPAAFAIEDLSAFGLKQIMDSGKPVFLLNPLSEIEFNEAHIPGSTNIPLEVIPISEKLPQRKDTLIVTYCKGPK
jgi:hypothetical protein